MKKSRTQHSDGPDRQVKTIDRRDSPDSGGFGPDEDAKKNLLVFFQILNEWAMKGEVDGSE